MKAKKIFIVLIIIASFSYIFQINIVQAALQSSGNTPAKKDRNTWMTQTRAMEKIGGGFGLTETQNTNLTSSSGSNNIDIHMQKNTEYGAMALLSASSYGNPNKITNGGTTTGNKSGIYIPYNAEWTAAQYTDHIGKTSYADRYINYYTINNNRKIGDATFETQGWHGSSISYNYGQIVVEGTSYNYYGYAGGIIRLNSNGIFSFSNRSHHYMYVNDYRNKDEAYIGNSHTSRAVIINGEGI